ncbi:MAG: hypothetical protein ACRC0X_01100 [Brevinema sp.]
MRILLLLVGIVMSQSLFAYEVNHRPKLYGLLGTGTVWLFGGGGFSYTAEIQNKKEDRFFHAITTDVEFLGIMTPSAFEFNVLGTYGIGRQTDKGYRVIVDLIGIGLNIRSNGYYTIGQNIAFIPPVGFVFTLPGAQFVFDNYLYVAWRNNFSIGNFIEFKSYIAIGYDFSKLFTRE